MKHLQSSRWCSLTVGAQAVTALLTPRKTEDDVTQVYKWRVETVLLRSATSQLHSFVFSY